MPKQGVDYEFVGETDVYIGDVFYVHGRFIRILKEAIKDGCYEYINITGNTTGNKIGKRGVIHRCWLKYRPIAPTNEQALIYLRKDL